MSSCARRHVPALLTCLLLPTLAAAQQDLPQRIREFTADVADLARRYDVPLSTERNQQLSHRYQREREQLAAIDFEALDRDDRVDWLLLDNHVGRLQLRLMTACEEEESQRVLLPFAEAIATLAEQWRHYPRIEPERAARQVTAIADGAAETVVRVADDPAGFGAAAARRRLADQVRALRRTLRRWFQFYDGYDPLFSWWARKPHERADQNLEALASALQAAARAGGGDDSLVGDPIGPQALQDELELEFIPYSPDELIAIAEREFAWCDAEMAKAAMALHCGDDWRRAVELVKRHHRAPGEQPEMIKLLADEAVTFLRERDLITIPELAADGWRMAMMSPAAQRVNPFFLGGETIRVSFPTDAMDHAQKLASLRSNNEHFCRATVHHELIPGHWLQEYMAARYRPYRAPFASPFWLEGWPLYWEMRLYGGLASTPEDQVGFLYWRKHRCARIVFSLNFHLGKWTGPECIAYLVDRVGHEPAAAEAEVRRSLSGGYGPLYQAAYMLGGLQFRALHDELVVRGSWTEKAFHDAVLRQGSMPVAVLRAALREDLPTRGLPPWAFADHP